MRKIVCAFWVIVAAAILFSPSWLADALLLILIIKHDHDMFKLEVFTGIYKETVRKTEAQIKNYQDAAARWKR